MCTKVAVKHRSILEMILFHRFWSKQNHIRHLTNTVLSFDLSYFVENNIDCYWDLLPKHLSDCLCTKVDPGVAIGDGCVVKTAPPPHRRFCTNCSSIPALHFHPRKIYPDLPEQSNILTIYWPVSLLKVLTITDSVRICRGPKRVPGLFDVPASIGTPTKHTSRPI